MDDAAGQVSEDAAGALASFSAAVAGGWGERDLAEVPRYFREFMLQAYD